MALIKEQKKIKEIGKVQSSPKLLLERHKKDMAPKFIIATALVAVAHGFLLVPAPSILQLTTKSRQHVIFGLAGKTPARLPPLSSTSDDEENDEVAAMLAQAAKLRAEGAPHSFKC